MDNNGVPLRASEIKMSNATGETKGGENIQTTAGKEMDTNTRGIFKEKNGEVFIIRHPTLVETDL
jgi:hypothetical protein